MSDVFYWERLEVVLFEEIVGAQAKQLKGDADVAVEVKPVQHLHTSTWEKGRKWLMLKQKFLAW